ncbi:MAG TPA: DNA polymerase IV [Solirubrobacteraceae bacterium]|nr:DNA polymerase IV [Solirubrobacteraceae bacterium]
MAGPIAHLDLDAFYATVELRRRPELRGLPVIVAGSGPRAVVTTASYEARRYGIGSAMPAARARRLCPEAIVIPPDFAAYREVSRAVMAILRAHVDRVEQLGLDEAYLDLRGLAAPKAAMRRIVAEIRTRTGMSASVGIGPNRLVAKVASDAEKPAGFVVLTREQACARFGQASPGLLPGIGPRTAERLAALGVTSVAQLGSADEAALVGAFGARQGLWLRDRGRFIGSDEIEPVREAVSESRETTFDQDIADAAQLEAILARLSGELCDGLRRHGRRGRTIAIKVRLDDWTTVTRARTIAHATDERGEVVAVATELLREYAPARPVRLLGVRVAGLTSADEPRAQAPATQLELPV